MNCVTFPLLRCRVIVFFSPQKDRFPLENAHVQDSRGGGRQGTVVPSRPQPHNHLYISIEIINLSFVFSPDSRRLLQCRMKSTQNYTNMTKKKR